ncbi:unnamed protein product, partial [Tilletia laevis]
PAPAGALASARQRALHVSTLRSSSSTPQDRREGQGLDLITTLSSSTQEVRSQRLVTAEHQTMKY